MLDPRAVQLYVESVEEFDNKKYENLEELIKRIEFYFGTVLSISDLESLNDLDTQEQIIQSNSLGINY